MLAGLPLQSCRHRLLQGSIAVMQATRVSRVHADLCTMIMGGKRRTEGRTLGRNDLGCGWQGAQAFLHFPQLLLELIQRHGGGHCAGIP